MEDIELLNRLQALEQRNAMQDRNNAIQSFINDYGEPFSKEQGLGTVIYDALQSRIGKKEIAEINADTVADIVDGLLDDIDMLQKYLKRSRRMEEDVLDDLQDRVQDLGDTKTKDNNPADSETLPETPDVTPDDMAGPAPDDFVDTPAAPAPDMPPADVPAEPAPGPDVPPADVPAEPAPDMPAEPAPGPAPVDPNQQPMMIPSDERIKYIQAKLSTRRPRVNTAKPESTKVASSIIQACGGN